MELNNNHITKLGKGEKLNFKAVRGKEKDNELRFDKLAGAIAVVCNSRPDGISTSVIFTILTQQKFHIKFGKKISRNMVAARMNKLWAIGHVQKKEEPIIRGDGLEEGKRYIWYIGEDELAPMDAQQQELVIEGKFTKKKMDRMFRDAYSFHTPQNKFEEAIFDVMSDTSETEFPIDLDKYKAVVAINFTEEIEREDRLSQLFQWAINAYPGTIAEDPKEHVITKAREYAKKIWAVVEEQMLVQQKMAESGLEMNVNEYERVTTGRDPDYWKSVKKLKEEKKI